MPQMTDDETLNRKSGDELRGESRGSASLYYEVSLRDFVVMMLKWSWLLVIVVAGGIALGTWWIKSTPPSYTVGMVISPVSGPGSSGASASPSLGGFAANLLGAGSSTTPVPRYEQFLHMVTSVPMAKRLQEKYDLLQLIKAEHWDAENKYWVPPAPSTRSKIKRFFGLPAWSSPNIGTLANFLRDAVLVSPIGKTAYRRISIEHSDPEFARTLLIRLYEEAEEMLRDKAMISTAARIHYIEKQLAKVTIADHRLALVALLSEQEKTMMLVDAGTAFSAEIAEMPVIPTHPTSPRPVSTLIAVALASIALGVVLIFIINMALGARSVAARHRRERQRSATD